MRKSRFEDVLFFSRAVATTIQSILKRKVSLKLCNRGKSGKQTFFYFDLSLCYIFGSNHAKVFLKLGVPKK